MTPHLPNRGEHTRHYFGYYSNAAPGRRKKLAAPTARDFDSAQATGDPTGGAEVVAQADADTEDFRREGRRTWARLIPRVYEVHP